MSFFNAERKELVLPSKHMVKHQTGRICDTYGVSKEIIPREEWLALLSSEIIDVEAVVDNDRFKLEFGLHQWNKLYNGSYEFYLTLKETVCLSLALSVEDILRLMLTAFYNDQNVDPRGSDKIALFGCQGDNHYGCDIIFLSEIKCNLLAKALTGCKYFRMEEKFHLHFEMQRSKLHPDGDSCGVGFCGVYCARGTCPRCCPK